VRFPEAPGPVVAGLLAMSPIKILSLPICASCILGSVMLATARAQGTMTATRARTLTAEQEEILNHMSIVYLDDGVGGTVKTIRLTGTNWQIVDGSGTTGGAPTGVGNLIVGYNELRGFAGPNDRTGSHNMIGGKKQNYSSYGGLAAGSDNTISGSFASVTGGQRNTASGPVSSVSGGILNTANGLHSSVSGGRDNIASGIFSSVSGGFVNTATGGYSCVSGGRDNTASGSLSSVSGGRSRSATDPIDWVAGSLFEDN